MNTSKMLKWWFIIIAVGLLSYASAVRAQGNFVFQLTTSADSAINPKGVTTTYSATNGYTLRFNILRLDFMTPLSDGLFEVDVQMGLSRTFYYSLIIQTPTSGVPVVGLYENAARYPFQDVGQSGMSFIGNGSGYNDLDGWFNILELNYSGNTITSLAIDFYQHGSDYGSGMNPWEFGSLRYNSALSITPVPEPTTCTLVLLGACALITRRFRSK